MMSSLRILQVLPKLSAGGVEQATLDMVQALRQTCSETFVASERGSLLGELDNRGGTHLNLPLNSKNPFKILRNGFRLAQLIRNHGINVIHARSRAPAWSALIASKLTRTPFVTTYHGAYRSSNFLKNTYNSVMARGDRVISISSFISSTIAKDHAKFLPRVRLIHEGINIETFDPTKVSPEETRDLLNTWKIPLTATVFLLPGRLSRQKGQLIFIDAIRRLDNPNIVGVILGQNPENSEYSMEVRRLSEGLPIRLIPYTSNPRLAYAASDFVVFPSLAREAFGRVAAEAGAMERIVIAANHGAIPEICLHEKTGFLVPPADSRALAQAMMDVMKLSPDQCLEMGKRARAHIITNYSLKRMYTETIKLYQELVP